MSILYYQFCSGFDFHEDVTVHLNGRADPRSDVHTDHENCFGVGVEDANEKADVDIGFETEKKGVTVALSATVVADWICVGKS